MATSVKNKVAGFPSTSIELLASSNAKSADNGTTSFVDFVTYTLPGGTMGPNDTIVIYSMWTYTGTTDTRTATITFGGSNVQVETAGSTVLNSQFKRLIYNNNSLTAQKMMQESKETVYLNSTSAMQETAVDTTADVDIVLKGKVTNVADTIALEAYRIELHRAS